MARVNYLADLSRERLSAVRGREEGRADGVFGEEAEESVDADGRAEDAAGYVGRVGGSAGFGVQPRKGDMS